MNHAVAVDASVAVKWVLEEDFSDRARTLLGNNLVARRPIIGPPHLLSEVTNVIYQRVRTQDADKHITESEAEQALNQLLQYPLHVVVPATLYEQAFHFAHRYQLQNVYDSLYVVLAELMEVDLWTDDRQLLRSLSSQASWVRWLGDYAGSEYA